MNDFTAADLRNIVLLAENGFKNIGGSDDAKVLLMLQNKAKGYLESMGENLAGEVAGEISKAIPEQPAED